ncbi:MAG: hypothetical protein Q8P64_19945 [Deltaproteobacteria bacterium]|jgi:hypothetical protein|nr:hypothetical protein [Deltaproteobacteria bacterium]MDP2971455.1 hypothetical protein [Deltaproteobacteria bacterium]
MMSEVGISKYFFLFLLILLVTLGAGDSHASSETWIQPIDGLRLGLRIPILNYKDSNAFQLSIIFENLGKEKMIILPESIHRNYQVKGHGAAKYVPFPGPPISPWRDAFTLLPGRKNEMKLVGMRDRDGIWILEPGTYHLSIRYIVPQNLISAYANDDSMTTK